MTNIITELTCLTPSDVLYASNVISTNTDINIEPTSTLTFYETVSTDANLPYIQNSASDYLISIDTSTEIIPSSTHMIIPSSSLEGPELDEILENLKKSIQIDKRQTNSFLRKHISASDPRVSSAVVGYVGAIIIVAILTVITILDLPFLMHTVMVSVSQFKNAMTSKNHTNVRNQKNYKNDAQEVVYV